MLAMRPAKSENIHLRRTLIDTCVEVMNRNAISCGYIARVIYGAMAGDWQFSSTSQNVGDWRGGGTEGELCGVLRAADVNVNIQRSSAP